MIITLKGANFSSSNIGTLSTWSISRVLGSGASYSGVTYVNKNASFSATVTISTGYELGSTGVTVTMGGVTQSGAASVSGNVVTISISKVTGNVVIKVPTVNTATGEESGNVPSATTWYINATNDGTRTMEASSGGTGPYYYHKNSSYTGKTINAVRFKAPQAGIVEYGKVINGTYTKIGDITVSNANIFETYTIPDLTLQSNEYIAFKGYFNYSQATDSPEATWFCSLPSAENKMNLGIDIGYVANESSGGNNAPAVTTWYLEAVDGFTLNSICNANGIEKYYYQLNTNYVNKPINAIKLHAATAGTFEYGITDGETYTPKGTATASSTGVVTINVSEFTITGNQLFYILTKTGAFKFGTSDPSNINLYFNGSNGSKNKMNLGISLGYVV